MQALPHGFCPLFGNLKRLGCGQLGGGFLSLSLVLFAHDSLYPGQRFGFHNFRHSLGTFLVSRRKDAKTIQGLLRHAKVTTTLDLYSQSIDAAKLEAPEDIALAITSTAAVD